jgi:hypothetical protein
MVNGLPPIGQGHRDRIGHGPGCVVVVVDADDVKFPEQGQGGSQ